MRIDHKNNLVEALSEWLDADEQEAVMHLDGTTDKEVAHGLANVLEAHIDASQVQVNLATSD